MGCSHNCGAVGKTISTLVERVLIVSNRPSGGRGFGGGDDGGLTRSGNVCGLGKGGCNGARSVA